MFEETPRTPAEPVKHEDKTRHLLTMLLVLLVIGNVVLGWRLVSMQSALNSMQKSTDAKLANMREYSVLSANVARKSVEAIRQQITETSQATDAKTAQVRSVALRRAEHLAKQLAEQQRANEDRVAQVTEQLSNVADAANDTSARVEDLSTNVSEVAGTVNSTRGDLERTIQDLKSVQGDLGVQSGLIATNAKELSALKQLGEKQYLEFSLGKEKKPRRLGDIYVRLKKADQKRNKYTVEIVANDHKVEKKDRTINEPVQFYVNGSRIPYEFVVNQVTKDKIVGYLASPAKAEHKAASAKTTSIPFVSGS